MGALAAVVGLTAVGEIAHFTCNFSILGDLLRGGLAAPVWVGGLAATSNGPLRAGSG